MKDNEKRDENVRTENLNKTRLILGYHANQICKKKKILEVNGHIIMIWLKSFNCRIKHLSYLMRVQHLHLHYFNASKEIIVNNHHLYLD
ncbi:hypothetical protein ACLMAB_07500 [Brevibacillus laterosporus]